MKLNNRFIYGIASIALAAVIAFVALPAVASRTNGKTEIVRVAQPIRRGDRITHQDIELVEVGEYNLPGNIAISPDDVLGCYATADLAAGDYILSSKVSFTPISSDIQLSSIPPGRVAISFTVKSLASGLSDKILPNDIIRVYHFLNMPREIPELQFVKVLTVTDSKGVNVDYSQEPPEDEEKRQSATITILATPEQARVITGLENDGMAHVALICRDNDTLADELLELQDSILVEIYTVVEEEDGESEAPDDEDYDESSDEDLALPDPEDDGSTTDDGEDE